MRKRLEQLERISRQLDPESDARKALFEQAGHYSDSLLNGLPETRTYTRDEGCSGFETSPICEDPTTMSNLLEIFRKEVDTTGILPASGGQMGYIPGGGLYPSALGDFIADISNRYSGVAFAGPGAARMEHYLVNWMCRLVGYPAAAAGDLTSGGSMATLSALVTARDAHDITYPTLPRSCIYLTAQAHHCIDKALHVAGLKEVQRRLVPMDPQFRMDAAKLAEMIRDDRQQGWLPWLVVGSAGTTDTGAVDPIGELGAIARQNNLWFHLDAAYGGFFRLCDITRDCLSGMERADSIVMDPHKGLGVPYGSGAVLIRDGRQLAQSNSYYANYMQDAKTAKPAPETVFSPADYSLELTRPFRGPRLWFPLKLLGLAAFRAALEEKILLARYFHEALENMEGFVTGPYPDLSIVTFRFCPASCTSTHEVDAINKRLLEAVHEDGKVFITSTRIDECFALRLAVLNFRTHRKEVDYLLGFLNKNAAELMSP